MKSLYGYDLDGVVFPKSPKRTKPFMRQTKEERNAHEVTLAHHYRHAKMIIRPTEPWIAITGRKEKFRPQTEARLSELGIRPMVLVMNPGPRNKEAMIELKLKACRKFGVTQFMEDDPMIHKALRQAGVNAILIRHMKRTEHGCRYAK